MPVSGRWNYFFTDLRNVSPIIPKWEDMRNGKFENTEEINSGKEIYLSWLALIKLTSSPLL